MRVRVYTHSTLLHITQQNGEMGHCNPAICYCRCTGTGAWQGDLFVDLGPPLNFGYSKSGTVLEEHTHANTPTHTHTNVQRFGDISVTVIHGHRWFPKSKLLYNFDF